MHRSSGKRIAIAAVMINITALLFYFAVQWRLGFPGNIHHNLFAASGSREYLEYSYWIGGGPGHGDPLLTFFYPLLVLVARSLAGNTAVWALQLMMWLAACNLVFHTVKKITGNAIAAYAAFALAASNISLINLTTFGLTEITVFFLLSLLLFLLAKAITVTHRIQPALWALLTVSLLAVTKPLYVWMFYAGIVVLLFAYRKNITSKVIVMVLLCSTPVLVQKAIGLITANTSTMTGVADIKLRYYLYTKVKYRSEHGSTKGFDADTSYYRKACADASALSKKESITYLAKHPVQSAMVFAGNIRENLDAPHPYISSKRNYGLYKWVRSINNLFFFLHIAAFAAFLFFLAHKWKTGLPNDRYVIISGTVTFYILLTSGISYWSGDRLVTPAVAAWSSCYVIMLMQMLKKKSDEGLGIDHAG